MNVIVSIDITYHWFCPGCDNECTHLSKDVFFAHDPLLSCNKCGFKIGRMGNGPNPNGGELAYENPYDPLLEEGNESPF